MFRTGWAVAGLVGAGLLVGAAGPAVASVQMAVSPGPADSNGPIDPNGPAVSGPADPNGPAVSGGPVISPPVTSPPIAKPAKGTQLTLSYAAAAGYAAALKLGCDPATGPHPKKKQACAQLKKAGGHPDRITPTRSMCYLIYAPIRADVTGTWKGRPVKWSKTYGNKCEMNRATGVLFQF